MSVKPKPLKPQKSTKNKKNKKKWIPVVKDNHAYIGLDYATNKQCERKWKNWIRALAQIYEWMKRDGEL